MIIQKHGIDTAYVHTMEDTLKKMRKDSSQQDKTKLLIMQSIISRDN